MKSNNLKDPSADILSVEDIPSENIPSEDIPSVDIPLEIERLNEVPASYMVEIPSSEMENLRKASNASFSRERPYFRWEECSHKNTYKLLNLIIKLAWKFSNRKDQINLKTWEEIAKHFQNRVTPASCRKKYCSLLKKYRVSFLITFIFFLLKPS